MLLWVYLHGMMVLIRSYSPQLSRFFMFLLFDSFQVALAGPCSSPGDHDTPLTAESINRLGAWCALFILQIFDGPLEVLLARLYLDPAPASRRHNQLVPFVTDHVAIGRTIEGVLVKLVVVLASLLEEGYTVPFIEEYLLFQTEVLHSYQVARSGKIIVWGLLR